MVDQYFKGKPKDQWWCTGYPPRPEQFGEFIARTETVKAKVEELVQRYRDVTPLAQEIAAAFPRFYVSVYTQGTSARLLRGTVAEASLPELDQLEVCFIPEREMGAHPSALYYKPEWRALMIAGVEWPDAALAAFLYHELGHTLRHRQGAVSATAPPGSDLYDDEEIAMHLLEADVLSVATGGQFARHVGAIITRFPVARDWRQAVLKLRADDLEQLDTLLGCRQSGWTVAQLLVAEYSLILGLTAIPVMPQAAYQQERRACYRWLRWRH